MFIKLARYDFFPLWKLALPLVLSGFVESSLGLTNTLFLSRLGPEDLAAGSLVIWFFCTLMVIVWGVFTGISVLVSHRHGASDIAGVARILRDAMGLACMLAIPLFVLIWNLAPVFIWLGQSPNLVSKAIPYMHALAFGIFPDLVGLSFMQFLIGLGRTRTSLAFSLTWVPLNIALNYMFMFGIPSWGLPALGMAGLGWGSCVAYWISSMGLGVYLFFYPAYRGYVSLILKIKIFSKTHYFFDLFKVGLPMGLMYSLEIGYFFTLALMMGRLGLDELDGNQIALQYLGFLSTFSFSMAQAITVRMGHSLGAKKPDLAKKAALAGMITAACFMIFIAMAYGLFPLFLIGLDFNINDLNKTHPVLIHSAENFLGAMGIFQLIESIRLSLFGALRAYKDTRFTLCTSVICFWGIGLPLGYYLAMNTKIGAIGYWWALSGGAFINVMLLGFRYKFKVKNYYIF